MRDTKVVVNVLDVIVIPFLIYLAVMLHPAWAALIPLIVGNWFFLPRYRKAEGWKFWR